MQSSTSGSLHCPGAPKSCWEVYPAGTLLSAQGLPDHTSPASPDVMTPLGTVSPLTVASVKWHIVAQLCFCPLPAGLTSPYAVDSHTALCPSEPGSHLASI